MRLFAFEVPAPAQHFKLALLALQRRNPRGTGWCRTFALTAGRTSSARNCLDSALPVKQAISTQILSIMQLSHIMLYIKSVFILLHVWWRSNLHRNISLFQAMMQSFNNSDVRKSRDSQRSIAQPHSYRIGWKRGITQIQAAVYAALEILEGRKRHASIATSMTSGCHRILSRKNRCVLDRQLVCNR